MVRKWFAAFFCRNRRVSGKDPVFGLVVLGLVDLDEPCNHTTFGIINQSKYFRNQIFIWDISLHLFWFYFKRNRFLKFTAVIFGNRSNSLFHSVSSTFVIAYLKVLTSKVNAPSKMNPIFSMALSIQTFCTLTLTFCMSSG